MSGRMKNRERICVTGITLSEAWKRLAKAPRPPLRTGISPEPGGVCTRAPLPVALPAGQITHGLVQCFRQKYSASPCPQITPTTPAIPVPARGAYRDRHGRWVRDAVDAAASGANGIAGRALACERPAGAQTNGA
jgi:hypothetical protein